MLNKISNKVIKPLPENGYQEVSLTKHASQLSNFWPLFLLLRKSMEQQFSSDGWSSAELELYMQGKGRNSPERNSVGQCCEDAT